MRLSLAILALIGGLAAGGARAHDGEHDECRVPMADWQPRDAVERMAGEHGWTVRRIRIDDGCYEVEGRDAEGRAIEVAVDPATLAILGVELEDDEDDRHGGGDGGEAGPPPEAGRHGD